MRKNKGAYIVFFLIALLFASGLYGLLKWRLDTGDVYPAGSSLRADRLGSQVLLETFAELPGMEAERNYLPYYRADFPEEGVFFVASAYSNYGDFMFSKSRNELLSWVSQGGRLVLAFDPRKRPKRVSLSELLALINERRGDEAPLKEEDFEDIEDSKERHELLLARLKSLNIISLAGALGYENAHREVPIGTVEQAALAVSEPVGVSLPKVLTLSRFPEEDPSLILERKPPSYIMFEDLEADWQVRYRADNAPVVVEREFGEGSVVLMGDSYMLTNEAQWRDRKAGFLLWLLDGRSHVVFDESYLGIVSNEGIMRLIRKHNLLAVLLGIVLVGALYIWRSGASLLPPVEEEQAIRKGSDIKGRDSTAGFNTLLHRTIPPGRLLAVCLDEWAKTFASGGAKAEECRRRKAKAESVLLKGDSRSRRDEILATRYREMAHILDTRRSQR